MKSHRFSKRTFKRFLLSLGAASMLTYAGQALSQNSPHVSAILDYGVTLDFVPKRAFFIVDCPSFKVGKVPGVFLPPYRNEKKGAGNQRWLVGAHLQIPPQTHSLRYSIVLEGDEDRYAFVPYTSWEAREKRNFGGSLENLRGYVNQRKEVLKSFEIQQKAQDESLRRLRADADLIADIGRIVEVNEEIERLKAETDSTEKVITNLKQYVSLAKSRPLPKNSVQMELDLTRQLAELSDAVKHAERGEGSRMTRSETELQRKISIIESTRFDDLDNLKKELTKLQRRRLELEQKLPPKPPQEPSYWDVE